MDDPVGSVLAGVNRNPAKTRRGRRTRVWEQNIGGGSNSLLSGNVQNQSVTESEPLQVYFDLQIFQEYPGSDPGELLWMPLRSPLQLEIDHRYRIQVTTSLNKNNATQQMIQHLVSVNSDMNIYLRTSSTIPSLTLRNVRATIEADEEQVENFRHDILLAVEGDCPTISLFLELIYEENFNEKIATRIPIELKGGYNEIEAPLWERVGIDTTTRPPESMALLHIESVETGKIRLMCWNRRPVPNRPDTLQAIVQPQIGYDSLALLANDPVGVQGIIDSIHDFFALDVPQLAEWFSKMIQLHHEKCCVVVIDETSANIPWEMLEVEDGKYLGAHAAVVRWTQSQYLQLRAMLQFRNEEQHLGNLLAYITPQDQEHSTHCPILSQLASKAFPSEEELKVYLSPQELHKVGLVYLRHPGSFIYGNEPVQLRQTFYNHYGDPVKLRFDRIQAPSEGRGPVVFVNACQSARVIWDGNKSYGLVKVLLAKLAGAFIGTLGIVEPSYAARFAQSILYKIHSSIDGVVLSDILRNLRKEAATHYLEDSEIPMNKLEMLYAFMYVYYGNPYARLQLVNHADGIA